MTIQHVYQLGWRQCLGQVGEASQVGKENGDHLLGTSQGHLGGIGQQALDDVRWNVTLKGLADGPLGSP